MTFNKVYRPFITAEEEALYPHVDEMNRRYNTADLSAPGSVREGATGQSWRGYRPTSGTHWKFVPETLDRMAEEGKISFTTLQGKPRKVPRWNRFLEDAKGMPVNDIWTDIPPVNSQAYERLGYPTQKPMQLLERIILTSTNAGDLVLDPLPEEGLR